MKLSDLTEAEKMVLCTKAWDHSYSCICRLCQGAWALMGPDGGEKGNWGPFKEEAMKQFCEEEGIEFIEGDLQ